MKNIRQKLLATFQVEHRDHLEHIRALLGRVRLERVALAGAALDEVFRRAHSLKGAARAVDLRPVEKLAHHMETLFSRVRQGALVFDERAAEVVLQTLDASEDCVAALGDNRATPGVGPAFQAIEHLLGIEAEPIETPETNQQQAVPNFQPIETVRVTAQNFDGLLRSAGGLLMENHRQIQVAEELRTMASHIVEMEQQAEQMRRGARAFLKGARPSREFRQMSAYVDTMARQTRLLSRQAGDARRLQQRSAWTLRTLSKQLQRDVWQARMVPAESLLEGFGQMVRDLARDQGKKIEFRASSTNVHADRRVLETVKDPVMHVLRNAVSHGIEAPHERAAQGKPAGGTVAMRVDSEGQRLTISIEDDGRGVDLRRVAGMAVQQGVMTEPEAAASAPHELARVLFRPGFSTAQSVTELSGRGMGLSVVDEAMRRLQGEASLQPKPGGGTVVRLSMPLSISTHRLLLVSNGGQIYAFPIHSIERLHRFRRDAVEFLEGKPVVMLQGQAAPLFSLGHLLGLEAPAPESAQLQVIVLQSHGRRMAVAVDAFLWESDAVIQDLGAATPAHGKVSGGILLDDGGIALVLNPAELLEPRAQPDATMFPAAPEVEKVRRSILVVDDSITTRTLEKSILEAHGYIVRVAVDGLEALARLREEKADLVVSDVQMPNMDGFELLEAMKKDPDLGRIPVIMVTSLERREDQERGLSLGADAYIVKGKFDQGDLLATIRQIV